MKPRIITDPPFPTGSLLACLLAAVMLLVVAYAIGDRLDRREDDRYRAACEAEGGVAFLGRHGRACLWTGAVIPVSPE